MKLTDSQRSEIRELMRPPVNCVRPNLEGLVRVFERYLERWGGIQWRDLRECNPTETAEYLVMHRKYDVCICAWTTGEGFGIDGLMITHWAEINLPNQTPAS